MAENGSILVTGAAGQLGAVGRTVTGHLVTRGALHRADRYDRLAANERPGICGTARGGVRRSSIVVAGQEDRAAFRSLRSLTVR